MTQYIPSEYFDYLITEIGKSDGMSVCTLQPLTYYNAIWPSLWTTSKVYVTGDTMRPPAPNGFVYECLTGGTSGLAEPVFGTVQDAEFSDGSVTWKTHVNYTISQVSIGVGDLTITEETYGRKLTTPQKSGVAHKSGEVTHTALFSNSEKKLKLVTTSVTDQTDNNELISGRLIVFIPFSFSRFNL